MTVHGCMFCHDPIDQARDYQRVEGFERHRSSGGTNHLVLREPVPGVWACTFCVAKLRRGTDPGQMEMVA